MVQDEVEFDPEALQAQIDLSMSLTQELVSSWIHPSYKLSKVNKDTTQELEEYLRRPPRLGVGAPLPETPGVNAREAARLKTKLVGKRVRDEERINAPGESSDEESRGKVIAVAKKARLDPFGGAKKGKKQTIAEGAKHADGKEHKALPLVTQNTARSETSLNGITSGQTLLNLTGPPPSLEGGPADLDKSISSSKKKRKRRKKKFKAGDVGL